MILQRLIKRAKELGYKKLILDTLERQDFAQRLYEKYGFQRSGKGEGGIVFYALEI